MATFRYTARDRAGAVVTGSLEGSSQQDILLWLRRKNYTPVSVEKMEICTKKNPKGARRLRIRSQDMASFCWQLNTMVEGGVTITDAIDTISNDIDNRRLQDVLRKVSDKMKAGETFHDSIQAYPKVFNALFCGMIRAGESSGTLSTVLQRLADYYDRKDELNRKVKRAMAYPAFVVGFVCLVIVVMMVFIVPQFVGIFEDFGSKLPAFTRGFMGVYDFVMGNALFIVGGAVGAVFLLTLINSTSIGHRLFSMLSLRIPFIGKLVKFAFVSTYGRTMATLIGAGVSVLDSMDILRDMVKNDVIKDVLGGAKKRIEEGVGIAMSMSGNTVFPAMMVRMVQVGEDSGSLSQVLDRSSDYYERQVDITVGTMVNIMEPVMVVLVGGIVLVVLLALYMPIFTMSDVQTV